MNKYLLPNCLLLVMALAYTSCRKDNTPYKNQSNTTIVYHINMPDSADNNSSVNASLNIHETAISQTVPDDFLGFSFEKQIVTDPTYFNSANASFINMLKNLGAGLIRIGGATVDRTFFSSHNRTTTEYDSLYKNDVNRYKSFIDATGWKTIWGLNLGTGTPDNDATEAAYVSNIMGGQIHSFAIGNEPAYFGSMRQPSYNTTQYLDEFNSFASTVRKSVPGVIFSGPENEVPAWGLDFMRALDNQINMLTVHYYRMGPAGNPNITMDKLLSFDPNLRGVVMEAGAESQSQHLPYRITECNSVYGGGELNMSNAHASALWGTEFLCYTAQQGVAGINFHTGDSPRYVYTPVSVVNGKNVARPLYYAMLLFHKANILQFTSNELSNNSGLNIDTYSFTTKDNKKGVMVINKDAATDLSITVNTSDVIQRASVYELTGPSLTSLTGTNINGMTVNDDGTFSVDGQIFNLSGKYAAVQAKIKPASVMLIIMD